jgi:hypothetical protein
VEKKTSRLSVGLVNYSSDQEIVVRIGCGPAKRARSAPAWWINGPSLGAINVPGQLDAIATESLPPVSLDQPVWLPAHSITVLTWP